MDFEFYLDKFRSSANKLDINLLAKRDIEVNVGVVMDSVYLKLYKREWSSDQNNPLDAETRIFFSIWVNEKTLRKNRVYYNIHALKLWNLKAYSISSRAFAAIFRKLLDENVQNWDNLRIDFGPLTLMEGWSEFQEVDLEKLIQNFAEKFLEIDHLIDQTLSIFKIKKLDNEK